MFTGLFPCRMLCKLDLVVSSQTVARGAILGPLCPFDGAGSSVARGREGRRDKVGEAENASHAYSCLTWLNVWVVDLATFVMAAVLF